LESETKPLASPRFFLFVQNLMKEKKRGLFYDPCSPIWRVKQSRWLRHAFFFLLKIL
jgi:hypothetical protein